MAEKKSTEEVISALVTDIIWPLYKSKTIKWKGKNNSGKYYSEIISDYLLEKDILSYISKIKEIKRKNYKTDNHDGKTRSTNRKEENFAKIQR